MSILGSVAIGGYLQLNNKVDSDETDIIRNRNHYKVKK